MRVCLITENELARTHGTGAQLLLIYNGGNPIFHHFYWYVGHGSKSESVHSDLLVDSELWIPRTRRLMRWLNRITNRAWWKHDEVNPVKLSTLMSKRGLRFDVAHVCVMHEGAAQRARSLLCFMGIPYVVHMMDILHDRLDEQTTPGLCRLIREADGLLALTPTIKVEMDRVSGRNTGLVAIGQPITECVAAAPVPCGLVEIVLTGRPYRAGCELLASAMPIIREEHPRVELVYYGAAFNDLPSALRPWVRDGGYLKQEGQYRPALARSHIAFLSGPSCDDYFARYSFPSRVVDLLMAGLPVVAVLADRSATRQILDAVTPEAVQVVQSPSELATAIGKWASSREAWSAASAKARLFAIENFALDRTKKQVIAALQATVKPDVSQRLAQQIQQGPFA